MNKTIPFVIDHLDPLGQGVSKRVSNQKQSTISFIPKTLPGEQGEAKVIKSSKGVEFAALDRLDKVSPQRIEAECPHYPQCSGCDYLHVSYADELVFKKNALLFLLRHFSINGENIKDGDIEVMPALQRFQYRNRVQLHYRHKYLGLINAHNDQVLEVPQCLLVSPLLKTAIDELYADKNWAEKNQGRGHVEIYERGDAVTLSWDQPYAHGGFSQVNTQMNTVLKDKLNQYFESMAFTKMLDLFSGAGNLSNEIVHKKDVQLQMVDVSPWPGKTTSDSPASENYLQLDLFDEGALDSFLRRAKFKQAELLLLDPPRKGFPALAQWATQLKPEHIVYVSCNPATMARDLKTLLSDQKKNHYRIKNVVLLDMFPGTHHFETIVLLQNK